MDFNSYIFILLFLPIVVLGYHLLNKARSVQVAKYWLILVSVVFISYADIKYCVFFIVSAIINLLFGYAQLRMAGRRAVMALGIVANVVCLGYFKYSGFILNSLNSYAGTNYSIEVLLVPIGISFWTFQQIAFLVDINRGVITELKVSDYLFYSFYFPKLVQGPITKYQDLISQFQHENKKSFDMDAFACGMWFFVVGLAKKVLIADVLASAVKWGYSTPLDTLTTIDVLLVMLCYTLQIYFDFSGYSQMAIGVSKMLNINIANNFDTPYQATSIQEFWKRWHISLTTFLREYIYFPLGGSKKGKIRTYVNIMMIYLVSGLWHGAAWTYVVWGALHGVASCLNRAFHKQWEKLPKIVSWIVTFVFVNITWVFFRAPNVGYAMKLLQKLVKPVEGAVNTGLLEAFDVVEFSYLASKFDWINELLTNFAGIEMAIIVLAAFVISLTNKERTEQFKPTFVKCILTMFLFFWSVISLSNVVEYIYGSF